MTARTLLLTAVAVLMRPEGMAQAQLPFLRDRPNFEEFNVDYDGRFTFVRLRFTPYRTGYGGGGGFFGGVNYWWDHDYPRAEQNFTTILDELTSISVTVRRSNILTVDDPALTKYPVAYLSEPGWWTITEREVTALRAYLLKGGFLIVDDFSGGDWGNFERVMRQVLPDVQFAELDESHPIFNSFYAIEALPREDPTDRRGRGAIYVGIFEDNDPTKRLMAIINYNNDIGDSWEWSDTGFIPIELTNEAYKLGVNYIVYAMTH
jgi:hypothetical protein